MAVFTTGGMGSDRHFARQQSSGPNVRFTSESGHRDGPDYIRRRSSGSLATLLTVLLIRMV